MDPLPSSLRRPSEITSDFLIACRLDHLLWALQTLLAEIQALRPPSRVLRDFSEAWSQRNPPDHEEDSASSGYLIDNIRQLLHRLDCSIESFHDVKEHPGTVRAGHDEGHSREELEEAITRVAADLRWEGRSVLPVVVPDELLSTARCVEDIAHLASEAEDIALPADIREACCVVVSEAQLRQLSASQQDIPSRYESTKPYHETRLTMQSQKYP